LVVLQVETLEYGRLANNLKLFTNQGGVSVTIKELERIEDRARRGLPIDPELILALTAYLREVLQEKINAEAVASEALKKAGLRSPYHTAA
jgi:hypothetical protein